MFEKRWVIILFAILAIILGIFIGLALFASSAKSEATNKSVCIYFFYGETCPHCAQEKKFLNYLKNKYPEIELHFFEVYSNKENQKLWNNISEAYGTVPSGVPMTFIGDNVFIGFVEGNNKIYDSNYKAYIGYSDMIEETIKEYINSGGVECPSSNVTIIPNENVQNTIKLPIFGEVSRELPIPLIGAILGLIDGGFNPCALSVLFFLIAYLMAIGSRKKCLFIGLTYSFMVFIVYFLFMYGVFKIISIIGYLETIKTFVGILIIAAGMLELKDFFWYGKGISLEIPRFAKSSIERLIKAATIPSAILLGVLVSLVEIPCAGAFPLIYLTILTGTSGVMNILYLLWYNIFFILPLIALVIIFYFGLMKVEEAEERRLKLRKYMRLIAGLIMFLLGSAMLMKVI